jgi:DNA-binding Xre family transcriptional regulator
MAVSYNKLWKILIDKRMKRIELMQAAGIGTSTLSKLGKDQYVSMEVLVKICRVLDCNIGDIVDYVKDKKDN